MRWYIRKHGVHKLSVGSRLREERQRLGLSQERLAGVAGVAKNTAINWEKDKSSPTAAALLAVANAGADAVYILTGKRTLDYPNMEHQRVEQELAEVRQDLIDPHRKRLSDETREQTEARVLLACRHTLENILRYAAIDNLPHDLAEQAQSLLDVLNRPNGVEALRAADFAQGRERRSDEWELLQIWLDGWPYQPDDPVMKLLVMMAIEYCVPHKALVELTQEIFKDIEEQHWADGVIRAEEAGKKGEVGGD